MCMKCTLNSLAHRGLLARVSTPQNSPTPHSSRARSLVLTLLALAAAWVAGCGPDIQGPPLTLDPAVVPATVCSASDPENAGVQTRVVLRPAAGGAFAPLPVDLLTPDASLAIPQVTLRAEVGGEVVVRQVEFVSAREMALWVTATTSSGTPLAPGLYTVTVTNPDGQRGVTMSAALRVVPPPTVSSVARMEPAVPPSGVDPDEAQTVCNGFTTTLSISGSNFRPTDPSPVVELLDARGATLRRLPDPDVRVMSSTEIRITLRAPTDASQRLVPGRYGLRVTNPDGASASAAEGDGGVGDGGSAAPSRWPQGCRATNVSLFNVVPPPELRSVAPVSACSSREQVFTVRGAFIRRGVALSIDAAAPYAVPGANVAYASSTGSTSSFDTLTVTVPRAAIAPGGPYALSLRNADGCASSLAPSCAVGATETTSPNECLGAAGTGPRSLTFYPDPVVTRVEPRGLCSARLMPVTVTGMNFHSTYGAQPRVEVRGVALENVRVTSPTTLTADIPMSLMPSSPLGTAYDVSVTVPEGCSGTLAGGFTLFPPPTLTAVRPGSVCLDRPSATLTLTGTNFHTFDGRAPTVRIGSTPPVELTGVQVLSPTSLTGTLPMNLPGGGPWDVTVTTPVGCPAVLAQAFTYHPAPTITGASPQASCTGGNPVLLITGTNFHSTDGVLPTVRLRTTTPTALGMVRVTSPGTILAELPSTLPMGTYSVEVVMPEGCSASSGSFAYNPAALIPPSLAGMIPSRGWNGIDMPVIIQGTGLATLSGLALRGAGAGGADLALTDLSVVGGDLINATIPAGGRAGGPYDLVSTVSGCPISLPRAYTITDTPAITLSSVTPPFGWTGSPTPVLTQGAGFLSTPRMFLVVPSLTPRMRALSRPVFLSGSSVSALVPQGLPPGNYDLAAINPDGGGGLLRGAFRVTNLPPPTVSAVTPGAGTTQSPTLVRISGANFRSPAVTLRTSVGASFNATVTASTDAVITVSLPTNGLTPGAYLVRVTNPDEGTYADFGSFVVTNPAQKLGAFENASALVTPRRGAAALASQVTPVTRFLYAIGGDSGAAGSAHDTVEFASVDLFGRVGAWRVQRYTLPSAVGSIAASAVERLGFLYVLGGAGASGAPQDSVLRAKVLDFGTAPVIADPELTRVSSGGLAPGAWLYRVSAVMGPADRDNPDGETLPSDEVTAFFVFRSTVTLRWAAVTGASSYRVYRSPTANGASGAEVLLATVGGGASSYTDDGTATPMPASISTRPLVAGSTGVWRAITGALRAARAGTAAAIAPDPSGNLFVYAITGRGSGGPLATYEYAPLSADGSTLGAFVAGAQPFADAREFAGAAVASPLSAPAVTAGSFVFVTGGFSARDSLRTTESGRVGVGGALTAIGGTTSYSQGRGGLGAIVVNNEFYAVGGVSGGTPTSAARDTADSSSLAANGNPGNFSNATADSRMLVPRSRFGFTLSGAYLFLVGGTTSGSEALSTVERTLY